MKVIAVKMFLSLCATAVLLIPFWIWLSAWLMTAPEGFWQKAFIVGIGAWFLGGLQFLFLGVLIGVLVLIWDS